MADKVRTKCPLDGKVDVWSNEIVLEIGEPERNRYVFRCPKCQLEVSLLADEKILGLLLLTEAVVSVPTYAEGGD